MVQKLEFDVALPAIAEPSRLPPVKPTSTLTIVTLSTSDKLIAVPVTLCKPLEALLMTIFSLPVVPIVRPAFAPVKFEIAKPFKLLVKILPEAKTAFEAGARLVTSTMLIA